MSSHRPLGDDGGLQLERTSLARLRTRLATATVALLLGMLTVRVGLWALAVLASGAALAAVGVPLRHREPTAGDERLHRWPALAWAGGAVVALGLLGAVTAWAAAGTGGRPGS